VLRFISLVAVREGTDVDAIVAAATEMIDTDPDILAGQAGSGLKLMAHFGAPESDYSFSLDFDDDEALNRWAVGPAHQALSAVIGDAVESYMVSQFQL
jgi:hypothetical protein